MLDCWPTGQAIDPAPRAWFINLSHLPMLSTAQYSLTVQNFGLKQQSFIDTMHLNPDWLYQLIVLIYQYFYFILTFNIIIMILIKLKLLNIWPWSILLSISLSNYRCFCSEQKNTYSSKCNWNNCTVFGHPTERVSTTQGLLNALHAFLRYWSYC